MKKAEEDERLHDREEKVEQTGMLAADSFARMAQMQQIAGQLLRKLSKQASGYTWEALRLGNGGPGLKGRIFCKYSLHRTACAI